MGDLKMTQDVKKMPDLHENYELTSEQISNYQKNGHIYLKSVAKPEEISVYNSVITDEVQKINNQSKPLSERSTYGKAFIQIGKLRQKSEAVHRFVVARRFAKIAADLMGVDGVRVYHDQALFKEPGGGHTPWHQDQVYWPMDTDNTITMWMPIVDVPEE